MKSYRSFGDGGSPNALLSLLGREQKNLLRSLYLQHLKRPLAGKQTLPRAAQFEYNVRLQIPLPRVSVRQAEANVSCVPIHMKHTFLLFLFILTAWHANAGDTTRIYYNKAWEKSDRDNASYYRKYWRDGQH